MQYDVKGGPKLTLIRLMVTDATLNQRRTAMEARRPSAWKPGNRKRAVSTALKAYAALTTSASKGAVRMVPDF
jgi:dihydroxy-acid dehydratase